MNNRSNYKKAQDSDAIEKGVVTAVFATYGCVILIYLCLLVLAFCAAVWAVDYVF